MENSMLWNLGIDPAYLVIGSLVLCLVLLVISIVCMMQLKKMQSRYKTFMKGKDGADMEECIVALTEELKALKKEDQANKEAIKAINRNLQRTFQSVGLVKYNAFPGMGGNASCAVALITQGLDGLVLNIVHSRENCYFYVKTVHNAKPDILLGKEEQQALDEALKEKPIKL